MEEEEETDHVKEAEGTGRSTETGVKEMKGAECARETEGVGVVNGT